MLTELCAEIRNYFLINPREDIHLGKFTISDGSIESVSFLKQGQYFRIVGSVFNDGVWKYGEDVLTDETFTGSVWAMAVPKEVLKLSEEIENWISENEEVLNSPYQSESFGGYSYSKGSGNTNGNATTYSWKNQFGSRLSMYRRISVL